MRTLAEHTDVFETEDINHCFPTKMRGIGSLLVAGAALLGAVHGGLARDQLAALTRKAAGKPIAVTNDNYEAILNGPRDYHLLLLLTSEAPQINCVLCREFVPDYNLVATSWFKDHPKGVPQTDDASQGADVYFLTSEFVESRNLFDLFQLNNIPKLYHFGPSTDARPNAFVTQFDEYLFFQGDHKEMIASWAGHSTGHKFQIHIPPNYTRIATNAFVTFTVAMLVYKFFPQFQSFVGSKALWGGLSLIAVLLLTSGYMFNQIRGVPYFREHGNGRVEYFAPGQQSQFGVETQILSFVYGSLSVLVVALIKKAPQIKNSHVNLIAVVVSSALVFFFYSLLLSIFGAKGTGYPYQFLRILR